MDDVWIWLKLAWFKYDVFRAVLLLSIWVAGGVTYGMVSAQVCVCVLENVGFRVSLLENLSLYGEL